MAGTQPVRDAAIVLPTLAGMELEPSQPVIYDYPIGLKLLHRDPVARGEHHLMHYPAGMAAHPHTHTSAHTIVVLEGRLPANEQIVGPGSYCHFPAGSVMHHAPKCDEACLLEIIFHGLFDVHPAPPADLDRRPTGRESLASAPTDRS